MKATTREPQVIEGYANPDGSGEGNAIVLEAGGPAQEVVLPVEAIEANNLGIGELMDLAEVLGTTFEGLAAMMRDRGAVNRPRIIVGYAWILARRKDPEISWQEAQRWRITVRGKPDPGEAKRPSGGPLGLEE